MAREFDDVGGGEVVFLVNFEEGDEAIEMDEVVRPVELVVGQYEMRKVCIGDGTVKQADRVVERRRVQQSTSSCSMTL
jgi:hypothetical protein